MVGKSGGDQNCEVGTRGQVDRMFDAIFKNCTDHRAVECSDLYLRAGAILEIHPA